MLGTLFVLRSATYAHKARQILQQNWIKASIIRTPKEYADRGCGYSLLVKQNAKQAKKLLQQSGIRILATEAYPEKTEEIPKKESVKDRG